MDKQIFFLRFQQAAQEAREFAQEMVSNPFPPVSRFFVRMDRPLDSRPIAPSDLLTEVETVSMLWKEGQVPEWVDIRAYSTDQKLAVFEVVCSPHTTKTASF